MDIIDNSSLKRVFYFHEFIYFINTISKNNNQSVENLVLYILDLLILFDEILIPSEHLTISKNVYEVSFKNKFLSNFIVKELIERKIIVTTIWSQCEDNIQHHEVVKRYMDSVGAKDSHFFDKVKDNILGIKIYQRNANYQSSKANSYTDKAPYYDYLTYEDNGVLIKFSHEKLLLGDVRKKMLDIEFIDTAKEAYINAMPDGNGRVYRALIIDLEVSPFHNGKIYSPINSPGNINPILFTYNVFVIILHKIGFRKSVQTFYKDKIWSSLFIDLSNSISIRSFRDEIFPVLEYISRFSLRSNEEIKLAMDSIYISHSRLGTKKIIFDVQKIFKLQTQYERIFNISPVAINEYNSFFLKVQNIKHNNRMH